MYRHTQSNYLALAAYGLIALVLIALRPGRSGAALGVIIAILAVVGVILVAFNQLTVTVDEDDVTVAFRWGWPRRRYAHDDITGVEIVRNKWWYGFGVRMTPQGWLYNVWGLDAVQLYLDSGSPFRIGTDQPEELAAALRNTDTGS